MSRHAQQRINDAQTLFLFKKSSINLQIKYMVYRELFDFPFPYLLGYFWRRRCYIVDALFLLSDFIEVA